MEHGSVGLNKYNVGGPAGPCVSAPDKAKNQILQASRPQLRRPAEHFFVVANIANIALADRTQRFGSVPCFVAEFGTSSCRMASISLSAAHGEKSPIRG